MISNKLIENSFKQSVNTYNTENTSDNIRIIKNPESDIDIKDTCIILYGRQDKQAKILGINLKKLISV